MLKFALVQHFFHSEEHPITVASHGDSKKKETPFMKVQRSTLDELKRNVAVMGASKAARLLNEREGGVVRARSAGQLVRNSRQAYNAKYTTVAPSVPTKWRLSVDPYLKMLTKCNKAAANKDIAFIRKVQLAPEPEIVRATETQIDLLEKFTTKAAPKKVLVSTDPTDRV